MYNKVYANEQYASQYATLCVSVGSVFAVLCLILLCHCLKKLFTVICKHNPVYVPLLEEVDNRDENSDDDILNVIDEGRISDSQFRDSNTPKSYNADTY